MTARYLLVFAILLLTGPGLAGAEDLKCPKGTTVNGERTPEVSEAWCETLRGGHAVFHGPYRARWPNGQLGTEGEYRDNKAVGTWKGWYPDGKPQGEEFFEDGRLVRGRYWDRSGTPIPKPRGQPNKRLEQPGTNARRYFVAFRTGR